MPLIGEMELESKNEGYCSPAGQSHHYRHVRNLAALLRWDMPSKQRSLTMKPASRLPSQELPTVSTALTVMPPPLSLSTSSSVSRADSTGADDHSSPNAD